MSEIATPPVKTWWQKIIGQWPLTIVLVGVFVGLIVVAATHWRLGSSIVGASTTLGGLLRFLPRSRSGLLAVRSRLVDIVLLLGVGIGIIALAWLIPPYRG